MDKATLSFACFEVAVITNFRTYFGSLSFACFEDFSRVFEALYKLLVLLVLKPGGG